MPRTVRQVRLDIARTERQLRRLEAQLSRQMLAGDREAARATVLELDRARSERKHLQAEYARADYMQPKSTPRH